MSIRNALPHEAELLSRLAFDSKGHWGYDAEFLEACREELAVTPTLISTAEVRVLERDGEIVAFYSLAESETGPELAHFFVAPDTIGRGCGKALWEDAVKVAGRLGLEGFLIHSDPNAEDFYRKQGAARIGMVPSGSIVGRKIPLLWFSVSAPSCT